MKFSRKQPVSRWLARLLTFLLVAPYLAAAPPARAQRGPVPVYVLDFNNRTTVGGALLGRVAAAQVSLQLAESANWDVVPEAQVQRRIQELGMKPPFDRIDRGRIATGVEADAACYGSIEEARVTANPPQATVRLRVVIEDMRTGVLINGAIAEAASTPRMGFTGDVDILLEEALSKAAFRAREFMERFRLPEGTVLNTGVQGLGRDIIDIDCLINVGIRQGVRVGMEMVVTRLRETVGRVRITSVDADSSIARVIESYQGVRPEDRVRAIFNFGDFPLTRSRLRSAAPAPTRVAKLAVDGPEGEKPRAEPVRVAKVQRGSQFEPFAARQDANGTQNGANGVPAPQPPPRVVIDEPDLDEDGDEPERRRRVLSTGAVRLMVGGLLLLGVLALGGRGGINTTRPHETEAFGFQFQQGLPGARIKICWDRPKSVRVQDVQQYQIYRFDQSGQFQIVGKLPSDTDRCFVDSEAVRDLVDVVTSNPGGLAEEREDLEDVPGIIPGEQYRYQVAVVYLNQLEDRDGDGEPDTNEEFISPLSKSSPWITAISPPTIVSPVNDTQVQADIVELTFQQVPGADTYFVWASPDPSFERRRQFGPFRTIPVDQGGPQEVTETLDLSGVFGGSRFLYLSVGARNSQDTVYPKPFGAIFGPAVRVEVEQRPPDPPGDGKGGDKTKSGRKNRDRNGDSPADPSGGKKGRRGG